MKAYVAAALALLLQSVCAVTSAQTQRALVIGINTYQPQGTVAEHPASCIYGRCELGSFENLDGAVNDAQAMADLLTSPKFGFPANQVVLLTNPAPPAPRPGIVVLPAGQTDHDGILAAMQKYLVDLPQRGDTVVFYDASHGSLRINSKGTKLTVLVGGKYVHADSTLVPADAYKGGYDIRDKEMARIFNAALDKGVHVTAIFDSCHSGGISRGIGPRYRERTLAYDPRDIAEAPELLAGGQPRPAPTERGDNPALVFSAAQQDQSAKEMPQSDNSSEPHGAFTAALIDALDALPVATPASVVYQRVKAVLEGWSVPDQDPEIDTTSARRNQPLFGGKATDSGKVRAAALATADDGTVGLDIGRVAGIGVGSEFTATALDKNGQTVKLRVTDLNGIARSSAAITAPAGATVAPGTVFELTKWVPADTAPLHVWLWPGLPEAEILAAAAQIHTSGASLIADPAEDQWSHVLSWDGARWTLQQAGVITPVDLGARLTGDALKQKLPAGAKLWANLPPPQGLAAKAVSADANSAVQLATNLAEAEYALAGTTTAEGPKYAWFHKTELAAGPPPADRPGHSPGCSTTSSYPVRSDWVSLSAESAMEKSSAALNKFALQLAKVHSWLALADDSSEASSADYYSLAVLRSSTAAAPAAAQPDATDLADQPLRQGDEMKLALTSTERVVERRWVYVLDIDCHGQGSLLYPLNYAENQFPNSADLGRQFELPGARTMRVGPPFGVDTLILLSTAQPLPDPGALNFEGAASRGARGLDSPLGKLLESASGGSRGISGEVPTDWGISTTTIQSIAKDAAK
jgi:hypothetical protein